MPAMLLGMLLAMLSAVLALLAMLALPGLPALLALLLALMLASLPTLLIALLLAVMLAMLASSARCRTPLPHPAASPRCLTPLGRLARHADVMQIDKRVFRALAGVRIHRNRAVKYETIHSPRFACRWRGLGCCQPT